MEHHNSDEKVTFGFWIYLMTDLLMFAVLFAAYSVLHNNNFGGVTIQEIFDPPYVLTETFILLISSFTCGLGVLAAHNKEKNKAFILLSITVLLGLAFLAMEIYEFSHLISEGHTPQKSAFLSSYFTLVGTHGLHIISGVFWMLLILFFALRRGLTNSIVRKITLAGIFWHFLDVVWIFIFTIVYLMSGLS